MRRMLWVGVLAMLLGGAVAYAMSTRDPVSAQGMELSRLTERNRQVIARFADLFYVRRDVPGAFNAYVAEDYVQHNPGAADGRAAAVGMLTPMFSRPGARFDIKRIIVDGDFAVIHLNGILIAGTPGVAVFDMYRLADGKIVEHWDAVQPVPTEAANPHPMF